MLSEGSLPVGQMVLIKDHHATLQADVRHTFLAGCGEHTDRAFRGCVVDRVCVRGQIDGHQVLLA